MKCHCSEKNSVHDESLKSTCIYMAGSICSHFTQLGQFIWKTYFQHASIFTKFKTILSKHEVLFIESFYLWEQITKTNKK